MRTIAICTDNPIKFQEMADMARLYGLGVRHLPAADAEPHDGIDAMVREQTQLDTLPDGRVEHTSRVTVQLPNEPVQTWVARVTGTLLDHAPHDDSAYNWDTRFVPSGSALSLHALKQKGLKVSARQAAMGAWLSRWLHYGESVAWRHMAPTESLTEWLAQQPILNQPQTAPTRAIIERVASNGAWFKRSENRRAKHYWWPGLNAGLPMTPKKDYVHELTFLVHDLIHWAMPDVLPSGDSLKDYRLYMVTRMMSEAITLVSADMLFIDQALAAGLEYDTTKRKIHPLYNSAHDHKTWCRAMSHYAIRGDDTLLRAIAKSPQALDDFKGKFGVFFEEDQRWTSHNAVQLGRQLDPTWRTLYELFSQHLDLGLTSTVDYYGAWSEDDTTLVDNVFEQLWLFHWEPPASRQDLSMAETKRMQRWWLGQIALTYKMDDLPLSGLIRQTVVRACLDDAPADYLQELVPVWNNYVDALQAMARLSPNDAQVFKAYYPVTTPLYVSYDLDPGSYVGIERRWAIAREMPRV